MKRLLFKLSLSILLCLVFSNNSYAVDCGPVAGDCQDYYSTLFVTDVIYLPGYPNCPIDVSYWVTNCNGVYSVQSLHYAPDFTSQYCQALQADLISVVQGVYTFDWLQHETNLSNIYRQIAIKKFESLEASGNDYDCPDELFYIEYRKPSCLSHCVSVFVEDTDDHDPNVIFDHGATSCVETICCVLSYAMCRNYLNELIINETSSEIEGCTTTTPPHTCNTTPPLGYYLVGPLVGSCRAQCDGN